MNSKVLGVFSALILCATVLAGEDAVAKQLDAAKKAYEAELNASRKAVREWFDKREDAARKDGSRKTVDQIKTERQAFEDKGELPKSAPASLRDSFAAAQATLVADYKAAVKGYLQAKKDNEAAAVEEQLEKFKKGSAVAGPGRPALEAPTEPAPDPFSSSLAGKTVFDPKTGILSVSYKFSDRKELADFECGDFKPVVSGGSLKLDAAQSIRHVVKFDTLKVTGVLGVRMMRGNFLTTSSGTQAGLGGAGRDAIYLNPKGDDAILSQIVPRNLRGGNIRFALVVEEKRTALQWGPQALGSEAAPVGPAQIELRGGEVGYTFSNLTISGKVNSEWAKGFPEAK